jgi:hypothetical protein
MWKERLVKAKALEEEPAEALVDDNIGQTQMHEEVSENEGLISFLDSHPNLQPTGRVVSIVKRQRRNFCGTLNSDSCVYRSKDEMQN